MRRRNPSCDCINHFKSPFINQGRVSLCVGTVLKNGRFSCPIQQEQHKGCVLAREDKDSTQFSVNLPETFVVPSDSVYIDRGHTYTLASSRQVEPILLRTSCLVFPLNQMSHYLSSPVGGSLKLWECRSKCLVLFPLTLHCHRYGDWS